MHLTDTSMKKVLKAAWEFCSFVFVPQRGKITKC